MPTTRMYSSFGTVISRRNINGQVEERFNLTLRRIIFPGLRIVGALAAPSKNFASGLRWRVKSPVKTLSHLSGPPFVGRCVSTYARVLRCPAERLA